MYSEVTYAAIDEIAIKLNIKSVEDYEKVQTILEAYDTKERASNDFWRERYRELAKEILQLADLPTTFKEHGLNAAFQILRDKLSK